MEKEATTEIEVNQPLFEHHRIVADPGQSQIRIDKFLMDRMEKVSRNKIQNAIRAGAIRVNDKEIKPNYKVRPRDVVTLMLPTPPPEGYKVMPEPIPLDIRYEDEDVIILHKPAGLVVHPGIGNYSGTLVNALAHHFKGLPIMEGNTSDRPGLVHRIDKDTSGLMVVAKNDMAMTHLARQFFNHTIKRTYHALVWGEPEEEAGTIHAHIGRNPANRFQFFTFPEGEEGKEAITHYKVLDPLYYVSLVECRLETGRTHQIRVHMKYLGHTLFNDSKYGGDKILKGTVFSKYRQFVDNCFKLMPRQALHARSLGFVHPRTGEEMYFEADYPEDFSAALEKWRNYLSSRKDLMHS